MRSWFAAFTAVALVIVVPAIGEEAPKPAPVEEAAPAAADESATQEADAQAAAGEPAEAPVAEPSEAPVVEEVVEAEVVEAGEAPASEAPAPGERHTVVLGPVGYDAAGEPGRIHSVVPGDTLWDISDAYLGTPWVWPAIWSENDEIQNPNLIYPGDKLWITPREMRRIGDAEASRMLAASGDVPAALADGLELGAGRSFHYSPRETVGFVSASSFDSAGSIMDSPAERTWLGDHDEVVVSYGRGEVEEGQQLEIFRRGESVKDPETGRPVGWNVEVLGWLEVTRVDDESSVGEIRLSSNEVRRGDLLRARPVTEFDIPVAGKPDVLGLIVHTPPGREEIGSNDIVYLNRGSADGLEVGSPLEVYRPMSSGIDRVGPFDRKLPDRVVAKLIVVSTEPSSSTAVVTESSEEINRGDKFRGADSIN